MAVEKYIVVLGGGESGVGAALLAQAKGYDVFVSDLGEIKDNYRVELTEAGIPFESGRHTEAKINRAQLVVKSPGIPDTAPLVRQLVGKGILVISEIEWAARFCTAMLVGITGSNGKTTTATLTHHVMQAAGLDVALAGNVGTGFARSVLAAEQPDIYVLELSSFQLDGIRDFRPQIAALLNVTPDHLDRYDYKLDNYLDSKFRITLNQQAEDVFLYFLGDTTIQQGLLRHEIRAEQVPLSDEQLREGQLHTFAGQTYRLDTTQLRGQHNARNALFAVEMALRAGADPDRIQEALDSYRPQAHRLEPVGELDGAFYINDSKATNVDAVYYALGAQETPVIWIAGGTDKGNDYSELLPLVQQKVKALICLGVDNTKLHQNFKELVPEIIDVDSATAAVETARRLAKPGDTILLSPACASFDRFRNYEDRGDQFRAAVQAAR